MYISACDTNVLLCKDNIVPVNNCISYKEKIGRKKSNFDDCVILKTGAVNTY